MLQYNLELKGELRHVRVRVYTSVSYGSTTSIPLNNIPNSFHVI